MVLTQHNTVFVVVLIQHSAIHKSKAYFRVKELTISGPTLNSIDSLFVGQTTLYQRVAMAASNPLDTC